MCVTIVTAFSLLLLGGCENQGVWVVAKQTEHWDVTHATEWPAREDDFHKEGIEEPRINTVYERDDAGNANN